MEEQLLEVIPAGWKKGIFKNESWAIVVTNQRLLFAKWTQELFNLEIKKRREEAKEEAGKSKFKQFFSQMSANFTYFNKYYNMKPDDILKEHPENFQLTPNDVSDVRLKRGMSDRSEQGSLVLNINLGGAPDTEDLKYPHELIITTNKNKMIFTFKKNFEKVKNAIGSTFKVR